MPLRRVQGRQQIAWASKAAAAIKSDSLGRAKPRRSAGGDGAYAVQWRWSSCRPTPERRARLAADDADLGQVLAELADQQVPFGAVASAHGAQVAFQGGVLDERRQGHL